LKRKYLVVELRFSNKSGLGFRVKLRCRFGVKITVSVRVKVGLWFRDRVRV